MVGLLRTERDLWAWKAVYEELPSKKLPKALRSSMSQLLKFLKVARMGRRDSDGWKISYMTRRGGKYTSYSKAPVASSS